MKLTLLGLVAPEIEEAARKNEIYRHLVCGVEVYKRLDSCAEEEISSLDTQRILSNISLNMFFGNRHYRVIHLTDPELYDPQSTLKDLGERIRELRIKGIGTLKEYILEQEDIDTAYVLTPLNEPEENFIKKYLAKFYV